MRRRRGGYGSKRWKGAHRWGELGRLADWRRGATLKRTDTVSSWFAGREEKDGSSRGLLSKDSQRGWPLQQSIDPGIEYTGHGARTTTPNGSEYQLTPPPPPPSYLKPNTLMSVREDWMRRASSPVPPAPLSGNPFATPPHSRPGSYDPFDRAAGTNNPPSFSAPFAGVKPVLNSDGNTPRSPASRPGALQENQPVLDASERRVATESSVPSASAAAAAPHSALGSDGKASNGQVHGHRRDLTIDTTNLSVPAGPRKDRGRSTTSNDKTNSVSDEHAAVSADLQKMFTYDASISDYGVHESLCGRFETTPTDECEEVRGPAVPESATIEAFGGIGFGIMGGKWDPRNSGSNMGTPLSSKRSKKTIKTPVGPMKIQSAITRGASVLSTSILSSGHEAETGTPSSPSQKPEMSRKISSSDHGSESKGSQAMSPGTFSSLFRAYSTTAPGPGPSGSRTSNPPTPPIPGVPISSDGSAPTPALKRTGGTLGRRGTTPVSKRGKPQGPPLAPRTAPPRRSVAPEDFSEDGLGGLSRANSNVRGLWR
jgi:hypothetical protein